MTSHPRETLLDEEDLRRRLEEAEETIRALRAGEADALLVDEESGQVYTLEAAHRPYRLLVEQMLQAAATLTTEGTILYANRHFSELLNRPLEALIGNPIQHFVAPSSRESFASMLVSARAAEVQGDVVLLRPDDPIPVHLSASALHEGALGQCLMIVDRTEQWHYQELQRTQALLTASEERFRSLAEAAPQMVWSSDPEGVVQYVNEYWTQYTGFTVEQTRDRERLRDVIHPDDYDQVWRRWDEARAAGGMLEFEFRLRRASDGAYRWFLSRSVPLRDEQGRVVRIVGANVDIDDRKQVEEALRNADRVKDEFLATLAHELRNPLAPIRNAMKILKMKDVQDPDLQWVQGVIERQAEVMSRLLEDLLDVSRLSRNQLQLRKTRVEIAAVIESALETSRPTIEGSSHKITVSVPAGSLQVDADRMRLAQVFSNLLINAAKYTEPGGHIWVNVERQAGEVVISVKDNGIGITAEMLPHVFNIFSQAEAAIVRSQGGLGIGLSLAQRLVDLHGGTIQARSMGPGRGAEFVVRLPAATPDAIADPPECIEDAKHSPSRCRVLVADDNRDGTDSLAKLLMLKGHQVSTAYDGAHAIEMAREQRPDVVMLDIVMPLVNGYDVCRRIREHPWGKQMFIIALTGGAQEEDRRQTEDAGFDHHIVKPADPDQLHELLTSVLSRS